VAERGLVDPIPEVRPVDAARVHPTLAERLAVEASDPAEVHLGEGHPSLVAVELVEEEPDVAVLVAAPLAPLPAPRASGLRKTHKTY
jgi:hypothetical protein